MENLLTGTPVPGPDGTQITHFLISQQHRPDVRISQPCSCWFLGSTDPDEKLTASFMSRKLLTHVGMELKNTNVQDDVRFAVRWLKLKSSWVMKEDDACKSLRTHC